MLLNYWFGNLFAALRGDGDGILAGAIDGIHDLFEFFSVQWQTVADHTEAITRLEDVAAAFRVTAAYVADIQDMASCPRSDLVKWNNDGDPVHPTFLPQTYAFSNTGKVYYTPIIVDRMGLVKKIRWIVGADSSVFSIDDYRIALCVYNPANGNIEKVWDSGNIKDAQANVANDIQEVFIDMGINQQCTPGQLLFVAHMQVAPGLAQAPRSFSVKPQTGVGRPADMLLNASSYRTSNGRSGIPSSIALNSLDRDNLGIPWAAVSVDPLPLEAP
ncbi:MAG: hypothetical protein DI630_16935 [Gordonia sp. (in: high G+C Gram-positive bacteria)]|nr:MAG: hypothetical protein DI630_16935 [Gordonia sp. (in: high G+C Gram-positive bacteria)]